MKKNLLIVLLISLFSVPMLVLTVPESAGFSLDPGYPPPSPPPVVRTQIHTLALYLDNSGDTYAKNCEWNARLFTELTFRYNYYGFYSTNQVRAYTIANLKAGLNIIKGGAGPEDLVIVFIATHGVENSNGQSLGLECPDANNDYQSWSNLDDLLDSYQNSIGCDFLIILEACRSGAGIGHLQGEDRAVVAGCQSDEFVYACMTDNYFPYTQMHDNPLDYLTWSINGNADWGSLVLENSYYYGHHCGVSFFNWFVYQLAKGVNRANIASCSFIGALNEAANIWWDQNSHYEGVYGYHMDYRFDPTFNCNWRIFQT